MSEKNTFLQNEGDVKFPMLRNLYDFYAPRCKSLEIWCFGLGHCGIESSLTESLGCSVKIYDHREEAKERFALCETALRTHKAPQDAPSWLKDLSKKWILPNKLTFHTSLPASYTGTRVLNNGTTVQFEKTVMERVDFVKIDYNELNSSIVYDILTQGYRPGLILIHWNENPDNFSHTMLAAGHLQNSGYTLLEVSDDWFLYHFNDQCVYESTSWARSDVPNPLLHEFKQNVIENFLSHGK